MTRNGRNDLYDRRLFFARMEYVEIVASLLELDRDHGSVNPLTQSSSSNGLPVKSAERGAVNLL